jgi:nicotinate-nucleotide adenylyltransferase
MSRRPRLGLLGGTFDPIHLGHLAAARETSRSLDLDRVRFIPAARPPHRSDSPAASGYHRLEMAKLAAADTPGWEVSDLELKREGPSYTYDTLAAVAGEGLTPLQIFFITGADAFAEIATWHRYPQVLDMAHFVVVARPGSTLSALAGRLPELTSRMIDSSAAAAATKTQIFLVAADTPDVSATDIRRRVAAREPIDGFVHPAVAKYIEQHGLYRRMPDGLSSTASRAHGAPGDAPGV